MIHTPVLTNELKALLNLKNGDTVIDATLDGGGHAEMLLREIYPDGMLLGIEQDPNMIRMLKKHLGKNPERIWKKLIIAEGNFSDIEMTAKKCRFEKVKAVIFDLGLSRWHFLESGRGFSFQLPEESLIMRMGGEGRTAADILNQSTEKELADVFFKNADIRESRKIARCIIQERRKKRFRTVGDLLALVEKVYPSIRRRRSRLHHPATRIFQALRIAVNDELSSLQNGLEGAWSVIEERGRIAVISYHSLEDRIVKYFFREKVGAYHARHIMKKFIVPTTYEILQNPSARSAKLRVVEKI